MFNQLKPNSCSDFYDAAECLNLILRYDRNLKRITQNDSRDVYITSMNINDHPDLIYALEEGNQTFYKFATTNHVECFFGRYDTGCHYSAQHSDCQPHGQDQRKLSFSILLNEEFEGGELVFDGESIEKRKGILTIFPSFVPHAVNPITSGVRYAIFGFLRGPHWR